MSDKPTFLIKTPAGKNFEINELPIELHIRGTISVTSREYGIYTPFYEREFFISKDNMIIKYKNMLSHTINNYCDVYKISNVKDNTFIIPITNEHEFKVNDQIRFCNLKNITVDFNECIQNQYVITNVSKYDDNIKISLEVIPKGICNDLFIMNMSLQNTIHISKSI